MQAKTFKALTPPIAPNLRGITVEPAHNIAIRARLVYASHPQLVLWVNFRPIFHEFEQE
jgi:hypothetical protein